MRDDMKQVLIERPRYASCARHPKRREQRRWDALSPKFESSSRHRGGSRSLSDLLGPLRRFLQSRVGRPWDKVYSELRSVLDGRDPVQSHVLDHLRQMVYTRVWEEAGVMWAHGLFSPEPVEPGVRPRYFVHPRTGLLCRLDPVPRKRTPPPKAPTKAR